MKDPLWTPSGELIFISDSSGFWNLYLEWDGQAKALLPMQAEFGGPAWSFGARPYQILPDGRCGRPPMRSNSGIVAFLNFYRDAQ